MYCRGKSCGVASNAGGEIRTLNPVRGLVFETSAYTVPPHRLVYSMIQHQVKEVNMPN